MHILTKIFVVLVSLLAVFMVPLVVVSTMNQEHWRQDALNAKAQVQTIRSQQSAERQTTLTRETLLTEQLTAYSQRQQANVAELEACRMAAGEVEARLITAESERESQARAQRSLAQSLKSAEQLTAKLVSDLEMLRTRALTAER
ncbi:MAG: hypothetical protein QGG74_01440, partial [Phycisphaerales bacterium]|nr:hypothetical protein [Phycisphaerales bacterium]